MREGDWCCEEGRRRKRWLWSWGRNWLMGMKFTDTMTEHRSDKKVLFKDFARCWAPFAAKDISYQCMLWGKDHVDTTRSE